MTPTHDQLEALVRRLRAKCAASGLHEHDGCSCTDAELLFRALQDVGVECATLRAAEAENAKLREEIAELRQLFDMQHDADQRAIKQWQAAHPGNDLVWPSQDRMVVWLMERHAADEVGLVEAVEALRSFVAAVDDLIADSDGVAGLHRNGDLAPWSELIEGGRFEEWLLPLSTASAIVAKHAPAGKGGE